MSTKVNIHVSLETEQLDTESAVRQLLELLADNYFKINSISANSYVYNLGTEEAYKEDV